MPASLSFVLTVDLKKVFDGKGQELTCSRCGETIELGQKVVSKPGKKSGARKHYHARCYEGMFIDV